jgi:UDP-glucose 4-epimerase
MTILITGANGFIGRHLTRRFLNKGIQVTGCDLSPCPHDLQREARLSWSQTDISTSEAVEALFQRYRPQAVVHLAYILPPRSEENPARTVQSNLVGFVNILRSASQSGTITRVVWSSSMAVYGAAWRYGDQPVAEDAPTYPNSLYGATKVMAEALACHYATVEGLSTLGFRANLVYGPGRERGLGNFKIWSRDMFFAAEQGDVLSVPAADQALDWIYVADVVRAIELMLAVRNIESLIFNVLGERRTVRDAVSVLRKHCPDARLKLQDGKLPVDQQPPPFDGRLAHAELGYRPTYTLEKGSIAYLEAIRAKGNRHT